MSEQLLKPVERIRVFEKAVEQLRSAILGGRYKPGDRLPTEQELCSMLVVGRSTLREALRVLEAEQLIEVRRGVGATVANRQGWPFIQNGVVPWLREHEEGLLQLLQVRGSIEGLTARLAAAQASDEAIAELGEIIQKQVSQVTTGLRDRDLNSLADLDVQFHLAIGTASGNGFAHDIVSRIVPAFIEGNKAVIWLGGGVEEADRLVEEHKTILKSIQDRDEDGAEMAMRKHIDRVNREILLAGSNKPSGSG
ncbi:MAG: FadR/GntR family transcriptional regulator [Anaerolineales bacterium]|jgi:GntR family transcriptional repressor for pyruvate dehydrogenase complex